MIKKVATQERILPRMCKVLHFQFDFDVQSNYIVEIDYLQDMNRETVTDAELYPYRLYVRGGDIYYLFHKSFEDRCYSVTLYEVSQDDEAYNNVIELIKQWEVKTN